MLAFYYIKQLRSNWRLESFISVMLQDEVLLHQTQKKHWKGLKRENYSYQQNWQAEFKWDQCLCDSEV